MNTVITKNTTDLDDLLDKAKNLPDAGGDVVIKNQDLTVTENGSYSAASGYTGLGVVTVKVPAPDVTTVEQATPEITVDSSGLITASATQEAGYVEAGTKSATKLLTTQAAQTIIPGTSNKTISSGRYLTGTQTIKGDANLKAANIKKGVSIFNVSGSYEGGGGTPDGFTKMAGGTITIASTTSSSITVDHNLGVIPDFIAWVVHEVAADATVPSMNVYGISIRKDLKYSNTNTDRNPTHQVLGGWNATPILGGTQKRDDDEAEWTTTQCPLYCNSTYRLQAGYTYHWVAGVLGGIQ